MSEVQPGAEVVPAPEAGVVAAGQQASNAPARLASEEIVVSAPVSFAGSAERIWKITRLSEVPGYRAGLIVCALVLIGMAWTFVLAWYCTFGLLLVPYRLIRRGQRKRNRDALQHREMMAAIQTSRHE